MKTLLAILLCFTLPVMGGVMVINSFNFGTTVTTDYANPGGTGERNSLILASSSSGVLAGDEVMALLNGANGSNTWFTAGALSGSVYLRWDFGSERVVNEAKLYQSSATAQGTWKWQGSDNASSWTDIGSSFAIAASATQALTELNGNTTAWRYYQMVGVSGSTNGGPYVYEMEFKIDLPASSTSYANTGGSGDRQATITETTTVTWNGTFANIINGDTSENNNWMSSGASSGLYIRFDFGSGKFIDQVKWYQSSATTQGVWKWQGSDDASSWTDVSNPFYLGAVAATQTIYLSPANATSYRYWQIIGVSGNASSASYQREVEFKIE